MTYCLNCGASIDEYDSGYYARNMNCIPCYNKKQSEGQAKTCSRCGLTMRAEEARTYKGQTMCPYCYSEKVRQEKAIYCKFCKKEIKEWEEKFKLPSGGFVCKKCHDDQSRKMGSKTCSSCGKPLALKFIGADGSPICESCAASEGITQPANTQTGQSGVLQKLRRIFGR